ncbi:hypothetical protein HYZ05_00170 [Candidatus Daviesbacteria bacterium]|nr:hypothetical protein [Candidatus Daviesbacteria bacterium]
MNKPEQQDLLLYLGSPKPMVLEGEFGLFQGFIKIGAPYFISYGLRGYETGYTRSDTITGGDPIQLFRTVRILEQLAKVDDLDFSNAALASKRVFFDRDGFNGLNRSMLARRRIRELIGRQRLREILGSNPSNLEEMITGLQQQNIWVDTETLEREIRVKRLPSSLFYEAAIARSNQELEELSNELEKDGRW